MSGVIFAATTVTAIAAAAAAKKKKEKEEEELTNYNSDDMDSWEFKIVRANIRKFKNSEAVQKVCAEEAEAGWELVEKFDDSRIRFKRRTEHRSKDQHLTIDPYRTMVGASEGKIAMIVIGVLVLIVLLGFFILGPQQ